MTLDEAMAELRALGTEKMRKINAKNGVGENQFGAQMGDLRNLAKRIKTDHELGLALWATGNWDAMLLATQIMKPKQLTAELLDQMVREVPFAPGTMNSQLAEWLMTNVVKPHPEKENLREKWMAASEIGPSRAAWSLTTERVMKDPEGLDLPSLLDRIEGEMGSAPVPVQWTMNYALSMIGVEFAEHRERAIAIGEKLGAFKDYPTSKGCISPYAPICIRELSSRK
ncbi:MAG: hypothetical protein HONBIEJF_01736 [Fimbriimonadaceae bacterium]|nr:hypothetical protein [Fimbriimonadaceae bacterium]